MPSEFFFYEVNKYLVVILAIALVRSFSYFIPVDIVLVNALEGVTDSGPPFITLPASTGLETRGGLGRCLGSGLVRRRS